jgi:hypothetical protein
MHELVLDDHGEDALVACHEMAPRPLRHGVHGLPHRRAHAIAVGEHGGEGRPARRNIGMSVTVGRVVDVGIDAAREKLVEARVERRQAKDAGADVIPREGRKMAHVEDEGMAQGNGLGEKSPGGKDLEDPVRARPGSGEPLDHCLSHVRPPLVAMRSVREVARMGPSGNSAECTSEAPVTGTGLVASVRISLPA